MSTFTFLWWMYLLIEITCLLNGFSSCCFNLLIVFILVSFLNKNLLLFIQLHNTDKSDQPNNSDNFSNFSGSCCLSKLCTFISCRWCITLSNNWIPQPWDICYHRYCRYDIQPKEERIDVFILGITSNNNFQCE